MCNTFILCYSLKREKNNLTVLEPDEDCEQVAPQPICSLLCIFLTLFCLVPFSLSDLDSDNMEMEYGKTFSLSW